MRSSVAPTLAVSLLVAALLAATAPPAAGQGLSTIVLTDPAGDQGVTAGQLVVTAPEMGQVDILSLAAAAGDANLTLTLTTSAAVTATQTTTVSFKVERGPTSVDGSTASGETFTLSLTGATAVTGVEGATVAQTDTALALAMPLAAIGASGGDLVTTFTVATADTDEGSAPPPVTQDNTAATDDAAGSPTPAFSIPRSAIQTGLVVEIVGGSVHQRAACRTSAPCLVFEDNAFTGDAAATSDGNATVRFDIKVTNTGTDADVVSLGIAQQPDAATASLERTSINLLHGEASTVALTLALDDRGEGRLEVAVLATSTRGGAGSVQAKVDVDFPEPPPVVQRTPVPEQLGFLTPMATSLGLDGALGEYAELALLAFFILVAVAVVFLVMFVTRTPWVRVQVTPKKVIVAPGGTAEFRLTVAPRRKRTFLARGTLRGEGGTWRAGLQIGKSERMPAGKPVDMALDAEAPDLMAGTIRVQVPHDAANYERETVEVDIVPLDDKGGEHPAHRATAKVVVEAAPQSGYASARDIQLAQVRHDPPAPRPGATVTTTATVHNAGGIVAALRVVLVLDGKPVIEERVEVPARGTSNVLLPWIAGAGKNQVKVQVFLA